ncbi:MAG: EAL domain-containing protein [Silicimonas sp.]|nr:EAL domain-containing protein [Silicimonas sp.]
MRQRQDLINALSDGRVECWYQPQFDAHTLQLVGAEALARLRLPDGAVLAPDEFLPLAEQTGLLTDIEELIFQRVLADQSDWSAAGLKYPPVAVNLSQHRLLDDALVDHVAGCLESHHAIALELLETAFLDNPHTPEHKTIKGLRALGLPIELDDFGSGRASIVAMITLSPDRIKIDRRLAEHIATRPEDLAMLQALVAVARAQGIGVVLEGIETSEQLEAARQIDCDVLQGFALAPPQTGEMFAAALAPLPRTHNQRC